MKLSDEEIHLVVRTLEYEAAVNKEQGRKWNWSDVLNMAEEQEKLAKRFRQCSSEEEIVRDA